MERAKLLNYTDVLLQKGLFLRKGQILVVNAPVDASDFVTLLTKRAYDLGASQVVVNWRSDAVTRLRYEHEELKNFEILPDWRRDFSLHYYRQGAAFCNLISANPYLMDRIDSKKIFAAQRAQNEALKEYIDGMMASKVSWLVAAVPGPAWARLLYPDLPEKEALDALWREILKASRADGDDPLEDWNRHLSHLKSRRQWMTAQAFTALRYTSANGTNLTVGLPETHIWQGGVEETTAHHPFNANIPTEEIYTAPHKDAVDGIVFSTKPLVYQGKVIRDFSLTFSNGKVTEVHAAAGETVLKELLQMDAGACRLGEVALIPYTSPISLSGKLFYETLFDENASCHLALGKAYPTCLKGGPDQSAEALAKTGLNDSMLHIDFMIGSADLNITGIKKDGSEVPVFSHGNWT